MGPKVGKAVKETWRNLLVEAGLVTGAVVALGVGAAWLGVRALRL